MAELPPFQVIRLIDLVNSSEDQTIDELLNTVFNADR
jgi:hypothetical protein